MGSNPIRVARKEARTMFFEEKVTIGFVIFLAGLGLVISLIL